MDTNMHKRFNRLYNRQEGMVAITVTVIIMIIVTLVVTSFAVIVRREQRQSLDRQLSSQALLAAEAGVEDARTALSLEDDPLNQDVKDCTAGGSFKEIMKGKITAGKREYKSQLGDSSSNIEYTCVLIDHTPLSLEFSGKGPQDKAFIAYVAAQDINKIRIGWQNQDRLQLFNNPLDKFPASGSLNTAAASITIMPAFGSGSITRDDLMANSHTFFAYPGSDGASGQKGTINYLNNLGGITANASQGQIVSGHCNAGNADKTQSKTGKYCNIDIESLNKNATLPANEDYFIVVKPLYQKADFSFLALDASGNEEELSGAQAVIDVTGKAADVLRRIQVRVPIELSATLNNISGILPGAALETVDEICKQLVYDGKYVSNFCAGGGAPIELTSATPGGVDGEAVIDNCAPTCPDSTYNPDAKDFEFKKGFTNKSDNKPPLSVKECEWVWGDGSSNRYPPSHKACQFDGYIVHEFEDTRAEIIASGGAVGCRAYDVKLIMRFNDGIPEKEDILRAYLPRGKANDYYPPDHIGPCYNKYVQYP